MYRYRYTDERGKGREKKRIGFKTEKEAPQALLEIQVAALRGETGKLEYSNYTIADWFDFWYETPEQDWKTTSRKQREMAILLQIKALLGHYKLQNLDKTTYKKNSSIPY
ncbi:hypothetical protein GLW04_09185 [Halobacillus litoralis]|uniref:AP2-like integrase N-terminal domain-containing protein n=1 Tax=Halobacillus litoralis TaxID=45668 RepID=A0A845DSD2_9BACI|nr:Arm DNA-binding domain-containing protein [Halobacillus litoralis]MYL20058.1 hypothetical protein [Halobacillus litoralis]